MGRWNKTVETGTLRRGDFESKHALSVRRKRYPPEMAVSRGGGEEDLGGEGRELDSRRKHETNAPPRIKTATAVEKNTIGDRVYAMRRHRLGIRLRRNGRNKVEL